MYVVMTITNVNCLDRYGCMNMDVESILAKTRTVISLQTSLLSILKIIAFYILLFQKTHSLFTYTQTGNCATLENMNNDLIVKDDLFFCGNGTNGLFSWTHETQTS